MGRPAGPTRDTKALICERALDVFAEKGYTASTMRDIARAAGMKDASLYNHFPSKHALFDATVSWQLERLTTFLRSHHALAHPEDSTAAYATDDPHQLLSTVLASYEPFFSDPAIVKLRHILEAERHADARIAQVYRTVFIARPIQLQRAIFTDLIASGHLEPCDTELAARQFHGAVFLALAEEMSWGDAQRFIAKHLEAFQADHQTRKGRA
ncbi:TetR/AcrR family transcriptional regulator [Enorma phocaeensis]|uniref:TetR/AcrR family transcriptional regulator n=1 Tax=Enorma phocaeensis TaxID=1871019 RepID=UPI002353047A|nr:TetR/AcrR family transcriptional regulator [Enorma phocaeensis]